MLLKVEVHSLHNRGENKELMHHGSVFTLLLCANYLNCCRVSASTSVIAPPQCERVQRPAGILSSCEVIPEDKHL